MLEINQLSDIRGNNVIIYAIKTLMDKNSFPKFSILSGHMGVGKSSVARLIAERINAGNFPVTSYNFGLKVDMEAMETEVFKMNPSEPRAFVFEEIHGMDKGAQTALLTMLDKQPANVYIVCTTTESFKVLRTLKSRASVWDFKLLGMRQLSQLLDDYLDQQGVQMSQRGRQLLVRSAYGVPRDLLKNTDLAIAGDFTPEQMGSILGNMSEDTIFSVLCALKSTGVDFALAINKLIDESSGGQVTQFRDFFTRYLLERKDIEGHTLDSTKISTLDSLFTADELERIGKTLIRSTQDTLILELSLLNLDLTRLSAAKMVGQQIDRVAANNSSAVASTSTDVTRTRMNNATLSRANIAQLKLGDMEN